MRVQESQIPDDFYEFIQANNNENIKAPLYFPSY